MKAMSATIYFASFKHELYNVAYYSKGFDKKIYHYS